MILETIIILTFLLDMYLTRQYLTLYKKRFPKNDYTQAEANPIIRFSVKRLGLNLGIFVSGLIIISILLIVFTFIPESSKWFFLGIYYMANVHHYVNNRAMKKIIKQKSKGGEK